MNRTLRGYALVLLAATLWGSLGLFYNRLTDIYGLRPLTVAFLRALFTASILVAVRVPGPILTAHRRDIPTVSRRDMVGFALFGLFGVAAFYYVYAHAIDRIGMGIAAVLMYTAPAWVTIISALFMDEPLTPRKVIALLLAIGGVALVSRVYHLGSLRLDVIGTLMALASGLTYGLYTIFSKLALKRYQVWTVMTYSIGFGMLFLLPIQSPDELKRAFSDAGIMAWSVGASLVPTLMSGLCFNLGLRDIPAANASIIATFETVVASALGVLFLGETWEQPQVLGGALILSAVVILSSARTDDQHPPS